MKTKNSGENIHLKYNMSVFTTVVVVITVSHLTCAKYVILYTYQLKPSHFYSMRFCKFVCSLKTRFPPVGEHVKVKQIFS